MLEEFNIGNNCIGQELGPAIIEVLNSGVPIRKLNISENGINVPDFLPLLPFNSTLKKLNLQYNSFKLNDEGLLFFIIGCIILNIK